MIKCPIRLAAAFTLSTKQVYYIQTRSFHVFVLLNFLMDSLISSKMRLF